MPYGLADLRAKPVVIGRIVTATITLVTVLIVYDGWATLKFFDVVLIVLGPIIAVVTSHVFSNSLVQQVELGRRPTMHEWLAVLRFESRVLLLAIPPLAILSGLRLPNLALPDAVQALIWLEAISPSPLLGWSGCLVRGSTRSSTCALDPRRRRGRGDRPTAASVSAAGQGTQQRRRSRPASESVTRGDGAVQS